MNAPDTPVAPRSAGSPLAERMFPTLSAAVGEGSIAVAFVHQVLHQ